MRTKEETSEAWVRYRNDIEDEYNSYRDSFRRNHAPEILERYAFFVGKQHVRKSYDSPLHPLMAVKGEAVCTRNICQKITESAVSETVGRPITINVLTGKNDVKVNARADAFIRLCKSWFRNGVCSLDARERAATFSYATGLSFLKVVFNPDKGRIIQGNPDGFDIPYDRGDIDEVFSITQNMIREGEIDVIYCSPIDVLVDPYAKRFDDVEVLFHSEVLPVRRIEEMFPTDLWGTTTKGRFTSTQPPQEYLDMKAIEGEDWTRGNSRFDGANTCELIRRYKRPSKRYPQGQFSVICGNVHIYHGPLPYQRSSYTFPFAPVYGPGRVPNSIFPQGLIERLISLQRDYNRGMANIMEIIRAAAVPRFLNPKGNGIKQTDFTTLPTFIEFIKTQGAPIPVAASDIPPVLLAFGEKQNELAQFLTGYSDIGRDLPPGATGRAVAFAEQIVNKEKASTLAHWDNSMQTVGVMCSERAKEFYPQERLVAILGKDGQLEAEAFKSDDYDWLLTVLPAVVSDDLLTPVSKFGLAEQAMQAQMLGNTPEAERARAMVGSPIFSRDFESYPLDAGKARRENLALALDPLAEIFVDTLVDHHPTHIDVHRDQMKGEEFLSWPEIAKNKLRLHLLTHIKELQLGSTPTVEAPQPLGADPEAAALGVQPAPEAAPTMEEFNSMDDSQQRQADQA